MLSFPCRCLLYGKYLVIGKNNFAKYTGVFAVRTAFGM